MEKKTKRNALASLTTIILVNLLTHTASFDAEKYKYTCLYMLFYLFINEVLKEN